MPDIVSGSVTLVSTHASYWVNISKWFNFIGFAYLYSMHSSLCTIDPLKLQDTVYKNGLKIGQKRLHGAQCVLFEKCTLLLSLFPHVVPISG